ncbi:hypothetical protein B0H14DRAFT_2634067 [Mycena olivaceomarginata]|nr:hypothetical protein B0H14DRAFT_2634067 [Mycena olivaceomarginata]
MPSRYPPAVHSASSSRPEPSWRAQHDKAVHNLIAQLLAHGLPEYFQIGAGDFSEENDCIRARNGTVVFSRFHVQCLQKIRRARVRRYLRLKFAHELVHPLFSHPEFPKDPRNPWGGDDGWDGHVWGNGGSWGPQPRILTALDDELSPFILPSPLPPGTHLF